jgi:excisionase family DNA binding protein
MDTADYSKARSPPGVDSETTAGFSSTPWMKPAVAAEYIGISLGTLRNWMSARFIPHSKRGRVVRYHRGVIDRWLAKGACPGLTTLADV